MTGFASAPAAARGSREACSHTHHHLASRSNHVGVASGPALPHITRRMADRRLVQSSRKMCQHIKQLADFLFTLRHALSGRSSPLLCGISARPCRSREETKEGHATGSAGVHRIVSLDLGNHVIDDTTMHVSKPPLQPVVVIG